MTSVCVDLGASQMNMTGARVSQTNNEGFSGEILSVNPDRVYLELMPPNNGIITFGAAYNPSNPGDIVSYPVSTRVVFDKIVPIDAVYFYISPGQNGSLVVFEGTTPEEN